MELSSGEARKISGLLKLLQVHLASAIESSLIPGTEETVTPEEAEDVKKDRRDWALAGRFISKIADSLLVERAERRAKTQTR